MAGLIFATATRALAETIAFEVPYKGHMIKVEGELRKPSGSGPFPVVIGLHACNGRDNVSTVQWLTTLFDQGYATYLPDSFLPRGYFDICDNIMNVSVAERTEDALLAAAALAARPDIRADKIAIVGVSHGAMAALRISRQDPSLATLKQKVADAGGKIVALVAFYGGCVPDPKRPVITPLLILMGAKDDWAQAKPCEEFASEGSNPKLVQIKVYPHATHSFDNPTFIPTNNNGRMMVYDGEATTDARARLIEFLRPLMQ